MARGLCSAHYQQWRYRERKTRLAQRADDATRETPPVDVDPDGTPGASSGLN